MLLHSKPTQQPFGDRLRQLVAEKSIQSSGSPSSGYPADAFIDELRIKYMAKCMRGLSPVIQPTGRNRQSRYRNRVSREELIQEAPQIILDCGPLLKRPLIQKGSIEMQSGFAKLEISLRRALDFVEGTTLEEKWVRISSHLDAFAELSNDTIYSRKISLRIAQGNCEASDLLVILKYVLGLVTGHRPGMIGAVDSVLGELSELFHYIAVDIVDREQVIEDLVATPRARPRLFSSPCMLMKQTIDPRDQLRNIQLLAQRAITSVSLGEVKAAFLKWKLQTKIGRNTKKVRKIIVDGDNKERELRSELTRKDRRFDDCRLELTMWRTRTTKLEEKIKRLESEVEQLTANNKQLEVVMENQQRKIQQQHDLEKVTLSNEIERYQIAFYELCEQTQTGTDSDKHLQDDSQTVVEEIISNQSFIVPVKNWVNTTLEHVEEFTPLNLSEDFIRPEEELDALYLLLRKLSPTRVAVPSDKYHSAVDVHEKSGFVLQTLKDCGMNYFYYKDGHVDWLILFFFFQTPKTKHRHQAV